jgi:AraC-like DNA-binding protein
LLVGQRINLSHLGIAGALMRYSPTLRAGLQMIVDYQHLDNQGQAVFLSQDEGIASLGCAVYQPGTQFVDQIYDSFLATACNLMRGLRGTRWTPEEVCFSRTEPSDVDAYRRFFRAPCRFNCEQTAMSFSASSLDMPMPEANPEWLQMLAQQALIADDTTLIPRLRRVLRILLVDGRSSAEQVAKLLFLHRRTLSRHLRSQGTTFRQVLDEMRFEAARQLLENTRVPLTEIAASLGYSESSAFSRAFRRWTGATPLSRRRLAAGVVRKFAGEASASGFSGDKCSIQTDFLPRADI